MDDAALVQSAAGKLIDWCAAVRRPLPWRLSPTYYARFLEALPDVAGLAAVEEDRLLKLWEGLGYYSRARNLKRAAERIMADFGGELPREAAQLKTLPGIGGSRSPPWTGMSCG